ncbi:MAG: restriction endonuclease subunit S [Roseibium sp.]|nr:restriction endonuclease subunit S [Roseibium sp.]
MRLPEHATYQNYKDSGVDWIGSLPKEWNVAPLGRLISVRSGDMISSDAETSKGYPIYGGNGLRGYTTKFNTLGPMILIGRVGAHCGNVHLIQNEVWASEHAYRVFPKMEIHLGFLAYAIRCVDLNRFAIRTAQPLLNSNIVHSQKIAWPSIDEQRAIAAFLDEKTAKIDEAVRIKEQQTALLKERKQILIQTAVTKGLNPDAQMKDSGIDWIGEIPAHWEVRRSKFLFTQSKEQAQKNDIQLSATQSYGVIPQEQFEELVGRRVVKISTNLEKRKHVELNDFVISMRSFQGGLERAYATGCIRSSYVILRPSSEVNPDFFGLLLKTPRYIKALQITGNFIRDGQDLTFENFAEVDLYIPPYEEQAEIALRIKEGCDRIDYAISIKEQQIAAFKEYKTSLINAAVTGKIKVV